MSAELDRLDRLERRYRRLLRCYPARWRQRHEEEMVAVLLDQAEAAGHTSVHAGVVADLVAHGAEERLESLLRWAPDRLRAQVAVAALVAGAGLALTMLGGEVIGARHRLPAEELQGHGRYFISGPFLTIGVGLYLAFMTAALLVVRGHGGFARLLLLGAVAFAAWLRWPVWSAGCPIPRPLVLALFAGLGLLAALATIRPTRRAARRLTGFGAALVTALALGLLLTKPFLGWSVGTMTTSGNVALAALATVLPFVGGLAIGVAALRSGRRPGWSAAIAVASFPVVIFCTLVSQVVNPSLADQRALFPVCYLVVLVATALVRRRGRERSRVSG